MDEKVCSVCGAVKKFTDYQKRQRSFDGVTAACKFCLRQRDQARYKGERRKRLSDHRRYMQTATGKEAHKQATKKWQSKNKEKRACHVLFGTAMKQGRIKKKSCEVCGEREVHGHHNDYAQPLVVRWLCSKHHVELHRK